MSKKFDPIDDKCQIFAEFNIQSENVEQRRKAYQKKEDALPGAISRFFSNKQKETVPPQGLGYEIQPNQFRIV